MRHIIHTITLAAGCLYAGVGFASDCHQPAVPETFPDAATASQAELVSAQASVKQYLSAMEAVLKCLDVSGRDTERDRAIVEMRNVAAKFNAVLKAFKARSG